MGQLTTGSSDTRPANPGEVPHVSTSIHDWFCAGTSSNPTHDLLQFSALFFAQYGEEQWTLWLCRCAFCCQRRLAQRP